MGARILVVDDSNTIRRVVCGILERHGFEPAPASDGQIAVEALTSAETPFDLVLLDFVMPKMNGFQFCRAIRAREEWKRLPVLLMSAKTDRIREQFVQQTGAIDAITKPFDAQALVAAVENALKRVATGHVVPAAPLVFDETEALSQRSGAVREEHAIRARATADFAAQLGNVLAPVIAKLPQSVFGDEGRIMEALTSKIDVAQIAQLARAVHAVDLSDKNAVVLTGNLGAIPIGAVLQLLQLEAQTGMLAIWNADSEVTIHMRGGLVDLVQSRGAGDEFRLGRFFLEQELVTEDQLDELVRSSQIPPASGPSSSQPSRLLGDMLVEAGHVNEAQLKEALTKQSSELIYEVLRWQAGRFEFKHRPGSHSGLAERARLAMPVASIVMEGFRRVDEWRVIEARLGSFDQVLLPDPASVDSMGGDKELARAEKAVLDAIDGERTVREVIAASHLSSFDACRILFQLIEARLVRRKAA
jgi:DNA-binding response OmpR family regulator